MMLAKLIMIVLLQTATNTPTLTPTATTDYAGLFPSLMSPTPWQTPTPMPTSETGIDEAGELLATAEGNAGVDFTADGEQIFVDGLPVLPGLSGSDSQQLFSYMKWATTPAAGSVFGPFSTILIPFGLLMLFALINLIVFLWETVLVSIFKMVLWLINRIIELIPY